MDQRIIVLAGNLGAGKTTLARKLSAEFELRLELESVDDNPYLSDFYQDMRRWSFHLQIHFLGYRLRQYLEAIRSQRSTIFDRCIFEDKEIFATALRESGDLSDRDYTTYDQVFTTCVCGVPLPDLMVFLHGPPEVLLRRIRDRGQSFDQGIDIGYLTMIDKHYWAWMNGIKNVPVISIDTVKYDFAHSSSAFAEVAAMVKDAIH